MKQSLCLSVFLTTCFLTVSTWADVRLPRVFSDSAVLQRDVFLNVWGWCDPGEKIDVSFAGKTVATIGDSDGRWLVQIPPTSATFEPQTLIVKGNNEVRLENILVGDVWFCGGQSNMEFQLSRQLGPPEETQGDFSAIRFNKTAYALAPEPLEDVGQSGWTPCKNGAQGECTAVGFQFALKLYQELNVPIGLIHSNWGGSDISWWTPIEGWKAYPELKYLEEEALKARALFQNLDDAHKVSTSQGIDRDAYEKICPDLTGAMYNAKVAPWTKYSLRGVIWYQGCHNADDEEFYAFKQRALVKAWRAAWKQDDMPFYWVQLPNFGAVEDDPNEFGWAPIRDGQTFATDLPNTGEAVTIDVGEADDIHPLNKYDVGVRLALWPLAKIFHKNVECQSPTIEKSTFENGKVVLTFTCVGGGLVVGQKEGREPMKVVPNGKLNRFAVAGKDGRFVWADATLVDSQTVVVSSDKVAEPVEVRYAWQGNPEGCNLYSAEGLPATPFRALAQ